jgi:hypothetical protein
MFSPSRGWDRSIPAEGFPSANRRNGSLTVRLPAKNAPLHARYTESRFAALEEKVMAKVLVLYYSAYGHVERMAHAVALVRARWPAPN